MSTSREIKEGIQRLSKTFGKDYPVIIVGSVTSVDKNARTCDIDIISGLDAEILQGVKLSANPNDGILQVPSIGSNVNVLFSNKNVPFVILFSDIDEYILTIEQTELTIKSGSISFGDGSFNGLVKVAELTTKLNNLENLVNQFVSVFNAHTHIASSFGSPTTPPPTPITTVLTPTIQTDIENQNIKHGSV